MKQRREFADEEIEVGLFHNYLPIAQAALDYINRLKAEKAVSDRALEIMARFTYDNYPYTARDIEGEQSYVEYFINKAKQELEKEQKKC